MTAIGKLQKVSETISKRKTKLDKISVMMLVRDIDDVVMSQKLSIGASIDASKASERLNEVRSLIDKNASKEDIEILLDDAVRLLQKAIAESVGKGRGSSQSDSN